MLIKPFDSLLNDNKKATEMSYLGFVEDNEDPEKLGRVRVNISIFEGCETEELPWACPILATHGNISSAGGLNVPELGSQVRVFFPNGDITAPYYTGAELNISNKTTFFDDDYPETYGYKDSVGNFIKVNKAQGTIHLQHRSSSNVKVAPDGSMQVSLSNGAYFTFSNQHSFELSIDGVNILGTNDGSLDIKTNSEVNINTTGINVNASSVHFSGDVSVGTGASGAFWTFGNLVTVKDGIIVSID